jgi:hypothetical protein
VVDDVGVRLVERVGVAVRAAPVHLLSQRRFIGVCSKEPMGKKIGCYIGFHDWRWVHTPDGERRQECVNCGKHRPELSGRTGIGGG